jgi:hypothetical protein
VGEADPFGKWLDRFADLSDADVLDLPEWRQPLAFIHQFALFAASDGAGSLFCNHPENVEHVADGFAAIDEPDLSGAILAIDALLAPFVEDGPPDAQDILIEQCVNGAATEAVQALDEMFRERWKAVYEKLEARARANGWT